MLTKLPVKNIFDIEVTEINKYRYKLKKFQRNVLLIVNIATLCGLSKKSLSELSNILIKFSSRGLKILLFPCDHLLSKKCKSVKEFKNYVAEFSDEFVLMDEVQTNGMGIHPLFEYLLSKDNEFISKDIKLNFTYFLVNREGEFVKKYLPTDCLLDTDSELLKCIGEVPEDSRKVLSPKMNRLRNNFDSNTVEEFSYN